MPFFIRPISAIALAISVSLAITSAQTPDPPSTPFLRIETGMHTATVRRIAVDPAERFLVTASDDKTVRVWDLQSGEFLNVLRPPQGDWADGKLFAVAISPDGATIAVGGFEVARNSFIYLFDRATAKLARRLSGLGRASVDRLAYSPDGLYLAAALSEHYGIRVYRTGDGQEIARDTNYGADTYSVEFDRAGRLVTASFDGALRLYDANFRLLAKRQAPGGNNPTSARFSPDASKVAVGFEDSDAVNVLSGQDLSFLYAPDTSQVTDGHLGSVTWSADGQFLYAGRAGGSGNTPPILRWLDSGRGPATVWPAVRNTIMDMRALSGGRLLFASGDPVIAMLDSDGRKVWQRSPEVLNLSNSASRLQLSRDGSVVEFAFRILTPEAASFPTLARFNIAEQKLQIGPSPDPSLTPPRTTGLNIADWENHFKPTLDRRELPLDTYERSRSLAISTTAGTFLLGTEWALRLFDGRGNPRWTQPTPSVAWAVNMTADRRYAVVALGDGTVRWYNIEDGKEVLGLFVHPDGKRWVCWTPEGFFNASPGGDALIGYHLNQGWDRAGEFIRVDQVSNLFYHPDLVAGRLKEGGAEAVHAARMRMEA